MRDCGSNAGTDMASERSPWAIEDVLDGNAEDLLQFFEELPMPEEDETRGETTPHFDKSRHTSGRTLCSTSEEVQGSVLVGTGGGFDVTRGNAFLTVPQVERA